MSIALQQAIKSLQRMDFPVCVNAALKHLELFAAHCNLRETRCVEVSQIVNDFILCEKHGGISCKNASKEFHILTLLLTYFKSKADPEMRRFMFNTIMQDHLRDRLLCPCISLAISMQNGPTLDCASDWIQDNPHSAMQVFRYIENDFQYVLPAAVEDLKSISSVSQKFACLYMATLTLSLYPCPLNHNPSDSDLVLPSEHHFHLVQHWLSPQLILSSKRLGIVPKSKKPSSSSVLIGVLLWTLNIPIFLSKNHQDPNNSASEKLEKYNSLCAELFLKLVEALFSIGESASSKQNVPELVFLSDLHNKVSSSIIKNVSLGNSHLTTTIDRLLQFIQICLFSHVLKAKRSDLAAYFQQLPIESEGRASRTESINDHYDTSVKVMLIGDSGVGKTCLLVRFKDGAFLGGSFISTVGIDFRSKIIDVEGVKVKLQIWDTAGQERFRSIIHAYYRDANALLLLYDITNKNSFENVRAWLSEIGDHAKENVVVMLLGNKSDLNPTRQVSMEDARCLAEEYGVAFMETSAKDGQNVELAFTAVARELLSRSRSLPNGKCFNLNEHIDSEQRVTGSSQGCCG